MHCTNCNHDFDSSAKFCPNCGATAQAPAPTQTEPVKPAIGGQLIFSILNIVLCGAGISTILGMIALVFTAMAGGSNSAEDAECKLKTARLLNFVGIVFAFLFVLAVVIIGIFFPVTIILELPA